MKKVTLLLVFVLSLFAFTSCSNDDDTLYITIGTAGTAGSLYPMGVAMAQTLTDHLDYMVATGEATAASVENLRNLHEGNMELGIAQTEVASLAYYGLGDYNGSNYSDIRALFSTINNYLQAFTLDTNGINTIDDLAGKNVGVGSSGSGGEMMARTLLQVYGLDYTSVNAQFMSESDAVSALKDGRIDAFICTHPLKSAALTELTSSTENVKMLNIDKQEFFDLIPAYTKYTVPAGTYANVDYDVVIAKGRITMCTSINSGLTDDQVYDIVKTIWSNRDEWASASAAVSSQVLLEAALQEIDIPLHPGAIRYFEEIGMTIPDKLYGDVN